MLLRNMLGKLAIFHAENPINHQHFRAQDTSYLALETLKGNNNPFHLEVILLKRKMNFRQFVMQICF